MISLRRSGMEYETLDTVVFYLLLPYNFDFLILFHTVEAQSISSASSEAPLLSSDL